MSDKETLRLRQRLVSFDGGMHFVPAFAVSQDEIERYWPALEAAMDRGLKARIQQAVATESRKAFLANYLAMAESHLIIGSR